MNLRLWMAGIFVGALGLTSIVAHAQTVRYIHTDALGSPVAVTNASRTVIEISEYEPYGRVVNRPVKAGPGYTGHVMDASTGLAYMQQRYYDPGIGRFLSVDPVTANSNTGANFNRYWYANNNPYKFIDLDGRDGFYFTDRNILVVPVYFTGEDATEENILLIKQKFESTKSEWGNMRSVLQVLDSPGGVGTNTLNLSPGYDTDNYPVAGQGVNKVGGNTGHINSSLAGWINSAAHDIYHFPGAEDGYFDLPNSSAGNRIIQPLPGYDDTHIMLNQAGDYLRALDVDRIKENDSTQKVIFEDVFRGKGS